MMGPQVQQDVTHRGNVSQVLKHTKPAEWAEIKEWMDPRWGARKRGASGGGPKGGPAHGTDESSAHNGRVSKVVKTR